MPIAAATAAIAAPIAAPRKPIPIESMSETSWQAGHAGPAVIRDLVLVAERHADEDSAQHREDVCLDERDGDLKREDRQVAEGARARADRGADRLAHHQREPAEDGEDDVARGHVRG